MFVDIRTIGHRTDVGGGVDGLLSPERCGIFISSIGGRHPVVLGVL